MSRAAGARYAPACAVSQRGAGSPLTACHGQLRCCADGLPIATEEQRYGLRVAVVGLPAHPLLTSPAALAVVGPAAFGHSNVEHVPLAQYAAVEGIPGGVTA